MAEYVQSTGPIGMYICATTLQHYGGGILSVCDQSPLNHMVQAVGNFNFKINEFTFHQ
jgi:hypothetical protein